MAILTSGDLSFEFCYTVRKHDWVEYKFFFCWRGESLINDSVLARGEDPKDRRPGEMFANEDREDGLIPFIEKALQTEKIEYWWPTEEDIIVGIYPNLLFPFLSGNRLRIDERGKPEDLFTLMVSVDTSNFKQSKGYTRDGMALHMVVRRAQLVEFLSKLKEEYAEFLKKYPPDPDPDAGLYAPPPLKREKPELGPDAARTPDEK